jgi:hypothetical protein
MQTKLVMHAMWCIVCALAGMIFQYGVYSTAVAMALLSLHRIALALENK